MRCIRCREHFEEGFDVCWNCGADAEGNLSSEFRHADAPAESDTSMLEAVGKVTGLYREPVKPWFAGDFILPTWIYPILIGSVIIAAAVFFPGRRGAAWQLSDYLPFAAGFTAFLVGIIMLILKQQELRQVQPRALGEMGKYSKPSKLPNGVTHQQVFEFIIEAKLSGVPGDVLQKQLVKAFQITPDHAIRLLDQVESVAALARGHYQRSRNDLDVLEMIAYDAFSRQPELLDVVSNMR